MKQEDLFAQKLEELKETAFLQNNVVTKEQIEETFEGFDFDEARYGLVEEYLKQCKIGVDEPVVLEDYLSKEEKNYLDQYLLELSALPKVSSGEKYTIARSAMVGDEEAKEKLIEIFLPYVVDIAKLYAGQGAYLEDLIGEGNVALTMGVQMLGCLEKAEEVDGMLGKMIMDAMEETIDQYVEESQQEKRIVDKVNKVLDAAQKMAEDYEKDVTVEELALESGLSKKMIQDAVDLSGNKIDFLDTKGTVK